MSSMFVIADWAINFSLSKFKTSALLELRIPKKGTATGLAPFFNNSLATFALQNRPA